MRKTKIRKLTITSCAMCPKCKIEQSPYTGDSFDMIDEDAFCTAKKKYLSVSSRPWQLEKELKRIPEWCPL